MSKTENGCSIDGWDGVQVEWMGCSGMHNVFLRHPRDIVCNLWETPPDLPYWFLWFCEDEEDEEEEDDDDDAAADDYYFWFLIIVIIYHCILMICARVDQPALISMVGDGHEIYEPTSHCRWDDHCPHIVTSLVGGQPWNIQGFLQMKFVIGFGNLQMLHTWSIWVGFKKTTPPPKKTDCLFVLFVDSCFFVLKHSMIFRWALLTRHFSILPSTSTRSPWLVFGATSFIGN